jgi:FixJ family two-component response regulator/anti-sigma regulatory factor (Ser/Thr protein kinase)
MALTADLNETPSAVCRPAAFGGRVLVVEDDIVSRNFLQYGLTKHGYVVSAAEDAASARKELLRLGVDAWDCVVTDYRMPNATGLELLMWVKGQDSCLSTIIVTAQGEKELIAESLRGGAADFLDKPVDLAKLSAAVSRGVEQTRRQRHMAQSESAVKELGKAQQWMLGAVAPRGPVQVDLCFHPKQDAGGDFFTRFQLSPHQFVCLLTDVSGHDLQAAYISAYFQGLVRGMLENATPIEEIFARFNRFLLEEWNQQETLQGRASDTSVAVCAILIDSKALTATVLTHGTPAPVHVSPDGVAQVVGATGGYPLGWFPAFEASSSVHFIAEGGYFYLWTDGLDDLAEKMSVNRLSLAFALQRARERNEVPDWIEPALDDILVARILMAPSKTAEHAFEPVILEEYSGADSGSIDEFQESWRRSLLQALPELSETQMHDALLASREVVLNALNHGCGGRSEHRVCFQVASDVRARKLRVRVCDPGPGHRFNVSGYEEDAAASLLEEHRGLILAKHLANDIRFERNGATVIMDFSLTP